MSRSHRNQIYFRMSGFPPFSEVSHTPLTCVPRFGYPFIFILHRALEWLPLFAAVDNAPMNVDLQMSLWDPAFNVLGHRPRRGITGSKSSSIFNFPRNCRPVFHGSCTVLRVHQVCGSGLSTSSPTLASFVLIVRGPSARCGLDLHFPSD